MANASTKWVIDPSHTLVEFGIKHLMISTVKGRFGGVSGELVGDPSDMTTAQVSVSIDAASVDTREGDRDNHLRSAEFFDVEKFPNLTYESREIVRTGDNQYTMKGELTIRDTTRPVELAVTFSGTGKDPWGNEKAAFSAEGKLSRKDFGLTWNAALETGGVLVGDEVKLSLEVQLTRQ